MIVSPKAWDDLGIIDEQMKIRIVKKLRWFVNQENPLYFATRLTGFFYGKYRFRIGDYRAIFDVDERGAITILLILRVKHRREVYE